MISKKSKYAVKALLVLAENYPNKRPTLISDLAEKGRIPKKFLELILLDLKNEGLLFSKKGKGGGYLLARKPGLVKLSGIIRILEGTLSPLPCLSQRSYRKCEECADEETCPIRMVMSEVREATVKILDGTSLQDMLERAGKGQGFMYAI